MMALLEPHEFTNRESWRDWLTAYHKSRNEIWLSIRRAGCQDPGLRLGEAVDEALCFGWIDSQLKPVDMKSFSLRFTPRRRKSVWAQKNIERVRELVKEGKMTPDGLAVIPEKIRNHLEES
jgi:uncharacterized protein YdeI (YjbR/CyaY-like superfamily)